MGKFGKVVERGDNRKWLKTDPKPNLLTITTGPPPYTNKQIFNLVDKNKTECNVKWPFVFTQGPVFSDQWKGGDGLNNSI